VGSAASVLLMQKNKSTWNWNIGKSSEVFMKESLRYCTNYSQRKNAASVGNKITDDEEISLCKLTNSIG
jgi:hypothetical protein